MSASDLDTDSADNSTLSLFAGKHTLPSPWLYVLTVQNGFTQKIIIKQNKM